MSIPVGSLAFTGYGDVTMEFKAPDGTALATPPGPPNIVGGGATPRIVALNNGKLAISGCSGPSPTFYTGYTLNDQYVTQLGTLSAFDYNAYDIASGFANNHFYIWDKYVRDVQEFDDTCTLITTHDTGETTGTIWHLAVVSDESAAYWINSGAGSRDIFKSDLAGNVTTFLSATGTYFTQAGALLALPNGDLLFGPNGGFVYRYNSSASFQAAYTLAGGFSAGDGPICLTPGLDPTTSFWVSYYRNDIGATPNDITVAEIQISDGTVLNTFNPTSGGFLYDGPFCVVRANIGPSNTDVDVDAGSYTITGSDISTSQAHVVSAAAGSYTITGSPLTTATDDILPILPERLVILPDESRVVSCQ